MKKYWVKKIPLIIAAAVLGVIAFSGITMLLWNSILPPVLHVGTITLLQATGILLLAKILFGGMRRRRHFSSRRHSACGQRNWHVAGCRVEMAGDEK